MILKRRAGPEFNSIIWIFSTLFWIIMAFIVRGTSSFFILSFQSCWTIELNNVVIIPGLSLKRLFLDETGGKVRYRRCFVALSTPLIISIFVWSVYSRFLAVEYQKNCEKSVGSAKSKFL